MSAHNIAIARRWFDEVWNDRREETIHELVNDDSVCYDDAGAIRGPEEFKNRLWRPFLAAFPNLRVTIEDVLASGDQVVVRWSARGQHTGEGLGFRASGRAATFQGMTWMRIENGKMIEGWQSSNIPEVVREMMN